MKMQKRKFRIGQLAKQLEVERFVVRFWEKEFGLKSTRSTGGQRFYDERDLEKFRFIKTLLYDQGFTISGARRQLNQKSSHTSSTKILGSHKTTMNTKSTAQNTPPLKNNDKIVVQEKIIDLQRQLKKLRELL